MRVENTLLAVVNFDEDTNFSVARAAEMAPGLKADIELFSSCYDEHVAGTRFFDSGDLSEARDRLVADTVTRLEAMAEPLRKKGLTVNTYATWHRPEHEAVINRARQIHPRLVLHDCQYHSAISRALFSHEDWQLIGACPVPLLLVKEGCKWHEKPRIWAAVDPLQRHDKPATLDKEILFLSTGLAESLGGTLDVVHSYDPAAALAAAAAPAMAPAPLPMEKITEEMRANHERHLLRLTDRFDIAHENVHNQSGSAREVLTAMAIENNIDLLVMGAIARTGLNKLMIGSTARRIIDHVPSDVLIVKPKALYATMATLDEDETETKLSVAS